MDPHSVFCPNPACPDKGQRDRTNIQIHSQKEQRYRCTTCGKTFAATAGTAFYRLHHPAEVMVLVVTLLCHGCPVQAIVAALGLDERTVTAWLHRTGDHGARVHHAVVQTGQVDLGQVQARRDLRQGVHGTHLAGDGAGRTHTAVAGRGVERDARRRPRHGAAPAGGRVRGQHGPPDLRRRL